MMEAAPSSALVVIKPDLLLQLEIVALDPPAELGQIDQALECDVGLQRGKPVVIRLGLAVRPLDQQPLFGGAMRHAHPQAGKARGQDCIGSHPPSDLLPGIEGKLQGQRLDRDRLKPLVTALADGTPATAGAGLRRQRLAGPPDRRGGHDADRVSQPEFSDPSAKTAVVAIRRIGQCHGGRHAIGQGLTHLLQPLAAQDAQIARVIEIVDNLAVRGEADRLIPAHLKIDPCPVPMGD
jgi:hypothetical protein